MFYQTYGFSASFTVEFWIAALRYENSLMQLAMTSVEEAFEHLGWQYEPNLKLKLLIGSAEPIKESKVAKFFRQKVAPKIEEGMLPAMRALDDSIHWVFAESDSLVSANVEFYVRKTGFFNQPDRERLSPIIQRLFGEVSQRCNKYSLGVSFKRK
jgi:hypothetical protein